MYILFKRHPLDDNEKIIGVFDDKDKVLKLMNELFQNDNYCYSVMYYSLNDIGSGHTIAYITGDYY